jgi:hypothetical protein
MLALSLLLATGAFADTDCDDIFTAWKQMGSSTGYRNGCTIPGVFMSNGDVIRINWSNKGLDRTISTYLGRLTSLRILNLAENELTGSIPKELGNLRNLDQLYLRNNKLTGSIPPQIGNLDRLTWLFAQHNQLSGPIPSELGKNFSLQQQVEWFYSIISGHSRFESLASYKQSIFWISAHWTIQRFPSQRSRKPQYRRFKHRFFQIFFF